MTIPLLNTNDILHNIQCNTNPYFADYYAFYSSWFGGIITEPSLMLLPIDDHMVHRGDGVFEAIKSVNRQIYLLDEHLNRLFFSAEKIALDSPFTANQIKEILLETLRAANQSDTTIRIFLARGPGSFSVNPYDATKAQLYIVITRLTPPAPEKYEHGVIIGKSHIPIKPSWLTQIKSCNYLSNVLMKKEAIDRHIDFVIGIDDENAITESATENILIVDQTNTLVYPPLANVLKGTTMVRACELAAQHGIAIDSRQISLKDLHCAREVLMTGTTLDVIPVIKFEDITINDGKPGPVTKKLNELIKLDMKSGEKCTKF